MWSGSGCPVVVKHSWQPTFRQRVNCLSISISRRRDLKMRFILDSSLFICTKIARRSSTIFILSKSPGRLKRGRHPAQGIFGTFLYIWASLCVAYGPFCTKPTLPISTSVFCSEADPDTQIRFGAGCWGMAASVRELLPAKPPLKEELVIIKQP